MTKAELQVALDAARGQIAALNTELLAHATVASVFQCGGRLHKAAGLRLGSDTVVAGMQWLLRQYDALSATWQPIETAPTDGTTVIGYDAARTYEPEEGLGAIEFMRFMDSRWLDPATYTMRPTHWMPLPDPPVSSPEAPQEPR